MTTSEQAMATWLASPMEFGEAPIDVHEIYREQTDWPLSRGKVELAFYRYTMANGYVGLGMTGPITWSFEGGEAQAGLSFEDLKRIFAGWYIAFRAGDGRNVDPLQIETRKAALLKELQQRNKNIVAMVGYLPVGDRLFYAFKETRGATEVVVATDAVHPRDYPTESPFLKLPVLYHYVGSLFFEGQWH